MEILLRHSKKYKHILFFAFVLICYLPKGLGAQIIKIEDKEGKPIIKGKIINLTLNSFIYFTKDTIDIRNYNWLAADSFCIQVFQYEQKRFTLQKDKINVVVLEPKIHLVSSIKLTNRAKVFTINEELRNNRKRKFGRDFLSRGGEMFMGYEHPANAKLEKISVFYSECLEGFHTCPEDSLILKLIIYSDKGGVNHIPDYSKNLLEDSFITIKLGSNNSWYDLDLTAYNIILSDTFHFIGFQLYSFGDDAYYRNTRWATLIGTVPLKSHGWFYFSYQDRFVDKQGYFIPAVYKGRNDVRDNQYNMQPAYIIEMKY